MPFYETPTSNEVDAVVPLLSSPQHEAYFFANLENPKWIGVLAERGFFSQPPGPERVQGGGVRFPRWPASQYLVRMARTEPETVAAILLKVQTENPSVIGDVVEAARAMPPAVAAGLVPTVARAAVTNALWWHFYDACQLCAHLAQGDVGAALDLATALFAPRPAEDDKPVSRRDEYWYKKGLRMVGPVLAVARPDEWLGSVCDWLDALIKADERVKSCHEDDGSNWWRPAVEEHEQNRGHDLRSVLVGAVREGFERAVQVGHLDLDDALAMLERRSSLIFRRIRLHLVKEFADQAPDVARSLMMKPELFHDHHYKHEYATLVGCWFPLLRDDERDRWFSWIDAGPDLAAWEKDIRESVGNDATEEVRNERRRYWQFEKLHWVRDHLDGVRKRFYKEMLERHGEPELADLNMRVSVGWGWGGSPFTVEELSGLTWEQAVERVASWVPPKNQFRGPTLEGLVNAFGEYVARKPGELSARADVLVGQPIRYVQKFFNQMTEAIKANREIDALAVLGLCRWVAKQSGQAVAASDWDNGDGEPHRWQWARDEISGFVEALVQARTDDLPRYRMEPFRGPIWEVLDLLARDPAGSYIVQDISSEDPRGHDYLTLGMNSPRGKALEAVLEYARWIANHIKRKEGDTEIVPGGFTAMPEVRGILEWQLAPGNRSVEALAIIGSRLGFIYWLDRDWLVTNTQRLFDLEGIERSPRATEGWAAWNAFLVWVRPHIEFYRLFTSQYAYAVTQSSGVGPVERSRERPMDHLGEHLMVLYGRGQLGLEDDGALLRRFIASTQPDTRRHAFEFVGHVLQGEKDLPQEFVDRYGVLWEEYWNGPGRADAQQKPDSLLFGMWFASGRFPPGWAVSRLEEFVEVAPMPAPDNEVLEELARLAPVAIERVVRILDRMVRADQEGWHIQMWFDTVQTILDAGIKAGGDAREKAEEIIDHLGRRGYARLEELLERGAS